MTYIEFIQFSVEHWDSILFWSILISLVMYFPFRNLVPAKNYDIFHLFISFNLGTSYAVVVSLYQFGEISNRLFFIIFSYAILIFSFLFYFLSWKNNYYTLSKIIKFFLASRTNSKLEINTINVLFVFISIILLFKNGLAVFTESNRFEDAKGLGFLVRFIDLFRIVIISYYTLFILKKRFLGKSIRLSIFFLIVFIIYSSLQNGAKFALIESFFIVIITIKISKFPVKIKTSHILFTFITSTIFALAVLSLNIKDKVDTSSGLFTENSNPLVDRLVFRILSNGDLYYLSLPNDVIDEIQTDNVFTRFIAQIIGNSLTSNLFGYDVSRYSVGKAILLYHSPDVELQGGPVSHLDLFSYKYFGLLGPIFIIFSMYLISGISKKIKTTNDLGYNLSVLIALWVRSLSIFIEPAVGYAYVIDIFIIIGIINLFGYIFKFSNFKML